ncbi:hypothetical protein Bca52824_003344 [Brassica carinata]|uniref:Dihydrodipicolinate reductase N-terminal domain-containing protein n=1 Tax=Brassica carinata TaxID=52824 RepID=A0A8X7WLV0_BRACI|nr:hypothetical protein Bca52824_003344 [Brassica carinata]
MATTNWLAASSSVFLTRPVNPRLAFSSRTCQTPCRSRVSFLGNAKRRLPVVLSMQATEGSGEVAVKSVLPGNGISIMVNGCSGKMGKAVIKAADSAGVNIVPTSFGSAAEAGQIVERERRLFPLCLRSTGANCCRLHNPIRSQCVDNAELYSKVGVPFVMGTTGGDRNKLYETVEEAKIYAVISPQMGKQVVAFLAAMEIMAEQFPGAFAGYSLEVMESHQASKLMHQEQQKLLSLASRIWECLTIWISVSFKFQHNVCGRSIYAEGTVDAAGFSLPKRLLKLPGLFGVTPTGVL